MLVLLYAGCAPVSAGTSLESLLGQPLPVTLAKIHADGMPLWAQMGILCLCMLALAIAGAVAGWFVGGFVNRLALSNRKLGLRVLFVAIALPIVLISAPLFISPGKRDLVTTVLGAVTAPIVSAALCYRFRRDGWPENVPQT